MKRALAKLWMPLLLVAISAWMALSNTSTGDYYGDTAPAVRALLHGEISAYLSARSAMGAFATLVQAPFAAIGTGRLAEFQWATFPCLLAAAALGLYLASLARKRGVGAAAQVLIPLLCLVNPLTFEAIRMGHPEEILTAALAVGAVSVASQGHGVRAALLLGLAIASKQWAVLAIFPTLMALPSRPLRTAILAAVVVGVLMAPALVAAPDAFFGVQGNAASGGRIATIWSGWYAATPGVALHLGGGLTAHVHRMPTWLEPLTHPLIVLLMVAVPAALWLRRGSFRLSGQEAMALLALLALARCALDPVDNLYYHVPLLLALLGWDALSGDRLPLRGLAGAAVSFALWRWSGHLGSLEAFNLAYLAIVVAAAIAIAMRLPWGRTERPDRMAPRMTAARA